MHATAAAADYLDDRLDPAADEVAVLGFALPATPDCDAADAVNVARSRLAAAAPATDTVEGGIDAVAAAVDERDPDEVLVGNHEDPPGTEATHGELHGTTSDDLGEAEETDVTDWIRGLAADRPVVIVPVAGVARDQ